MRDDPNPTPETGGVPTSEAARRLLAAWRGELEARYVYDVVVSRERDPRRADILRRIADGEMAHRARIEARLHELGVPLPDPATVRPSRWKRQNSEYKRPIRHISRFRAVPRLQ